MNRRREYADADKAKRTAALQKRRYRARTGSGYEPREWTRSEEKAVVAHVIPDRELAVELGRSVQAIQVKRSRLMAVDA